MTLDYTLDWALDFPLNDMHDTNHQGLIQNKKWDINGEQMAHIRIVASKIVTHELLLIIIIETKQAILYIYFLYFHYACIIIIMIKKLELQLRLVLTEVKIKFGHTQISMPKIGMHQSLTTEQQIAFYATIL